MKRVLIGLLAVISLCIASPVSAHFLKTDGQIGAVLHINPDDDPIAGQATTALLAVTDTSNRFVYGQCACSFQIIQNGKPITTEKITANGPQLSLPLEFTNAGVYQLVFTGKPLKSNDFQSFSLSWDIRVEPASTTNPGENLLNSAYFHIVLIGGATGFLVYRLFEDMNTRKKKDL